VNVNDLVLVQGMKDTKLALAHWNGEPGTVLRPWLGLSALISLALLFAVYVVAKLMPPDPTVYLIPGYNDEATIADYAHVLFRNSLVLALHALACVAGFIAGSSLPLSASHRSGISRWVHEKAGPLAIAFVVGATLFSLTTQAWALGAAAATLSAQLGLTPFELLLGLSLHAVPELFALFLPLAAWTIASRRKAWNELLAATFVTVAIAIPIILASAAVETWVSPRVLQALAG
jgi:uncharacterized membrane protein